MQHTIKELKNQLEQLQALYAAGALLSPQYEESRATLERRIVEAVMAGDVHGAPSKVAVAAQKPSMGLIASLILGVLVIAAAGYWWTGSPGQVGGAATEQNAADASGTPHATSVEQIAAMAEKLAARMQEHPEDPEGWSMLARSYSVLGKFPEALKAYEQAVALRKDDANLLADYADAMAVNNNRTLAGDAMKQVNAALKIDPRNIKALSLAGTYAFNQKDYTLAARYWGQVVQFGSPESGLVQQIAPALAEARSLAGLPAAEQSSNTAAPAGADKATATSATVSGTVTLSAALRDQVQATDTVFIFARAAQGSRMPLAIVRKQVKDLPFDFSLDDSTAMSPANTLSGASKIIVGARISKSGNAMPQPGDLSGQTAVVDFGASGLKIEIKDVVKP